MTTSDHQAQADRRRRPPAVVSRAGAKMSCLTLGDGPAVLVIPGGDSSDGEE
jgi:hypothetical protein